VITDLILAAIVVATILAAIYLDRHPWPASRLARLQARIHLQEAMARVQALDDARRHALALAEADGFMAIAERVQCTACTVITRDSRKHLVPCDLHDDGLWDSLERRYQQ
jgi:hypothetical protein